MDHVQIAQLCEAIKLPFGLVLKCYSAKDRTYEPYRHFLRVVDPDPRCNVTGKPLPICQGRRWELSEQMLPGEIVSTAWLAVQTYVEHEMREQFTFKGAMVYGPHLNVDRLVELASSPDGIVQREHNGQQEVQRGAPPEYCQKAPAVLFQVDYDAYAAAKCRAGFNRPYGAPGREHFLVTRDSEVQGGATIDINGQYWAWTAPCARADLRLHQWIDAKVQSLGGKDRQSHPL